MISIFCSLPSKNFIHHFWTIFLEILNIHWSSTIAICVVFLWDSMMPSFKGLKLVGNINFKIYRECFGLMAGAVDPWLRYILWNLLSKCCFSFFHSCAGWESIQSEMWPAWKNEPSHCYWISIILSQSSIIGSLMTKYLMLWSSLFFCAYHNYQLISYFLMSK